MNKLRAYEFEEHVGWNEIIRDMAHAEMDHLDKQLYGAWRAGYDYLYVVEKVPSIVPGWNVAFIPSNSPEHKFLEFRSTRYDLRREDMSNSSWEYLMEYEV